MNIPLHLLSLAALGSGAAAGAFLASLAKLFGPLPARVAFEPLRHGAWMAAYSGGACVLVVGLNLPVAANFCLGAFIFSALLRLAYNSSVEIFQLGLIAWAALVLSVGAFVWSVHPDACASGTAKERLVCAAASAKASVGGFLGSWLNSSAVSQAK